MAQQEGNSKAETHTRVGFLWLLGAVVIATFCFVLFSTGNCGGRGSAKRTANLSNIKQVGLAILQYAEANDSYLPIAFTSHEDLRLAAELYNENSDWLESINPDESEFLPNPELTGVSTYSVAEPEITVLAMDSKPWPDMNLTTYVFVDGHAKYRGRSGQIRLKPFITDSWIANPVTSQGDNVMAYKFTVDGTPYLLEWMQAEKYFEVTIKVKQDGDWVEEFSGTSYIVPTITHAAGTYMLYLVAPNPYGADETYHRRVTIDENGISTEMIAP